MQFMLPFVHTHFVLYFFNGNVLPFLPFFQVSLSVFGFFPEFPFVELHFWWSAFYNNHRIFPLCPWQHLLFSAIDSKYEETIYKSSWKHWKRYIKEIRRKSCRGMREFYDPFWTFQSLLKTNKTHPFRYLHCSLVFLLNVF